ncbi:hypothetical protein [Verrucosispora sp. NA02020]|uniref:hypothetical protein n=1 Tax=Verrucosispora sp. NA02020 TaxID=2742132 RepID=UPI003D70669F
MQTFRYIGSLAAIWDATTIDQALANEGVGTSMGSAHADNYSVRIQTISAGY